MLSPPGLRNRRRDRYQSCQGQSQLGGSPQGLKRCTPSLTRPPTSVIVDKNNSDECSATTVLQLLCRRHTQHSDVVLSVIACCARKHSSPPAAAGCPLASQALVVLGIAHQRRPSHHWLCTPRSAIATAHPAQPSQCGVSLQTAKSAITACHPSVANPRTAQEAQMRAHAVLVQACRDYTSIPTRTIIAPSSLARPAW